VIGKVAVVAREVPLASAVAVAVNKANVRFVAVALLV
jgi:hypothetical protein